MVHFSLRLLACLSAIFAILDRHTFNHSHKYGKQDTLIYLNQLSENPNHGHSHLHKYIYEYGGSPGYEDTIVPSHKYSYTRNIPTGMTSYRLNRDHSGEVLADHVHGYRYSKNIPIVTADYKLNQNNSGIMMSDHVNSYSNINPIATADYKLNQNNSGIMMSDNVNLYSNINPIRSSGYKLRQKHDDIILPNHSYSYSNTIPLSTSDYKLNINHDDIIVSDPVAGYAFSKTIPPRSHGYRLNHEHEDIIVPDHGHHYSKSIPLATHDYNKFIYPLDHLSGNVDNTLSIKQLETRKVPFHYSNEHTFNEVIGRLNDYKIKMNLADYFLDQKPKQPTYKSLKGILYYTSNYIKKDKNGQSIMIDQNTEECNGNNKLYDKKYSNSKTYNFVAVDDTKLHMLMFSNKEFHYPQYKVSRMVDDAFIEINAISRGRSGSSLFKLEKDSIIIIEVGFDKNIDSHVFNNLIDSEPEFKLIITTNEEEFPDIFDSKKIKIAKHTGITIFDDKKPMNLSADYNKSEIIDYGRLEYYLTPHFSKYKNSNDTIYNLSWYYIHGSTMYYIKEGRSSIVRVNCHMNKDKNNYISQTSEEKLGHYEFVYSSAKICQLGQFLDEFETN